MVHNTTPATDPGCLSHPGPHPLSHDQGHQCSKLLREARSVSHTRSKLTLMIFHFHATAASGPWILSQSVFKGSHCSWKSVLGSSPNLHIERCSFSRIRQYFRLYKIAESIWAPASCCQGSNLEFILYMTCTSYYVFPL